MDDYTLTAPRKIYKVAQINAAARMILEANFNRVWVEGEISNLSEPSSGHAYFSLKDATAQLRAVMFRNYRRSVGFPLQNGAQVVAVGQVSLYEARGDYQLIVDHIEPAGLGVLHAKFLQLKAKLEQEGLFVTTHKKQLPGLPRCIGIITSATGAAVHDILTVLKRRFPLIPVIIFPVPVQGAEAAPQIVAAIELANERAECDVLIVARGGGSLEDLWPFNEEIVARAIYASKIPIVSAVGHEIDFTIADFVADVRAPTPSVAAEIIVPDVAAWLANLVVTEQKLLQLITQRLREMSWTLQNLINRLRHPQHILQQQIQKLDEIERRLFLAMQHQLKYCLQRLNTVVAALNLVSPLQVLIRGYAILSKDGKNIKSVHAVNKGDEIQARVTDGEIKCLVI